MTGPDPLAAAHAHHQLYRASTSGSRAERLAADSLWWAWEWVDRQMQDPSGAVATLDLLLHIPDAADGYVAYVAAGPLEDVLVEGDPAVREEIALRCRQDPTWAAAAAGVWLSVQEWTRLPAELGRLVPGPTAARPPVPPPRRRAQLPHGRQAPRPSGRNRPRRQP